MKIYTNSGHVVKRVIGFNAKYDLVVETPGEESKPDLILFGPSISYYSETEE